MASKPLHDRAEIDFLLDGLEAELRDGLKRLTLADAADDHAAWYLRSFKDHAQQLRRALNAAEPHVTDVAFYALQTAFLGRIWPILRQDRSRRVRLEQIAEQNKERQATAIDRRARCVKIAAGMRAPTAAAVRVKYATLFPLEKTPDERTIRRYLEK